LAYNNRPPYVLIATSLGALGIAILLAVGPFRSLFGFVPISTPLAIALASITGAYLAATEVAKRTVLGGLR
jgi:Mg2+-importing ATPase